MSGDENTRIRVSAFLFDLDGTLIDSELLWCRAIRQMMQARRMPISEAYSLELVLGRAWRDIADRLRRDHPALTDDDDVLVLETNRYYEQARGATDIRIHSSMELLERLARRYPVAVVSGSTRGQVADAIEMMGVADSLRFYLGSEDYPRGKPHPDCFLMAARKLGIVPGECLVFEDSTAGVKAARAAGMKCIALQRKNMHRQDVSAADQVLEDLADFDHRAFGVMLD
jgi:HAD superfamily hydrolase (TIGR01509 family)